jgi:hypothetical protein
MLTHLGDKRHFARWSEFMHCAARSIRLRAVVVLDVGPAMSSEQAPEFEPGSLNPDPM